jgi:hypothetical protein
LIWGIGARHDIECRLLRCLVALHPHPLGAAGHFSEPQLQLLAACMPGGVLVEDDGEVRKAEGPPPSRTAANRSRRALLEDAVPGQHLDEKAADLIATDGAWNSVAADRLEQLHTMVGAAASAALAKGGRLPAKVLPAHAVGSWVEPQSCNTSVPGAACGDKALVGLQQSLVGGDSNAAGAPNVGGSGGKGSLPSRFAGALCDIASSLSRVVLDCAC